MHTSFGPLSEGPNDVCTQNCWCHVCNAEECEMHSLHHRFTWAIFLNTTVCSCSKLFVKWPENIGISGDLWITPLTHYKWNAVKDAFYLRDRRHCIRYQACSPFILNSYDTCVRDNKFHPLCRWIPLKLVKVFLHSVYVCTVLRGSY